VRIIYIKTITTASLLPGVRGRTSARLEDLLKRTQGPLEVSGGEMTGRWRKRGDREEGVDHQAEAKKKKKARETERSLGAL